MKQFKLFEVDEFIISGYKRVQHTAEYIEVFRKLFCMQEDVLYNHSIVQPFSYLNKGRLSLFINADYKSGEIIPIIQKFKNNPTFSLYCPRASDQRILETVEKLKEVSGKEVEIVDATDEWSQSFISNNPNWQRVETSKDVVYNTEKVHVLEGSGFSKIRNKIRRAEKCGLYIEEIRTEKHLGDAIQLFEHWKQTQGEKYFRVTVGRDKRLIEEYWDKVDGKNFFGYNAYIENECKGVVFGNRSDLKPDWGIEVTTKADIHTPGASDYIRQYLLSRMYSEGIKFVNDSGFYGTGVKVNKTKWLPDRIIKMYKLKEVEEKII